MSHFAVAVFTDDLDKLEDILEPYCEIVDEDSPYAEWEEDDSIEEGGYYTNPGAKWDWYVVGGRWENMLRLKNGERDNYALVSQCDFTPDKKAYDYAIRFWEINVEGKPKAEDDPNDYSTFWKPEYFTERYASKEEYAESEAAFSTWAFIDNEGEWHERGEMGWWAANNATRDSIRTHEQEFVDYLEYAKEHELYIVIVDCHI